MSNHIVSSVRRRAAEPAHFSANSMPVYVPAAPRTSPKRLSLELELELARNSGYRPQRAIQRGGRGEERRGKSISLTRGKASSGNSVRRRKYPTPAPRLDAGWMHVLERRRCRKEAMRATTDPSLHPQTQSSHSLRCARWIWTNTIRLRLLCGVATSPPSLAVNPVRGCFKTRASSARARKKSIVVSGENLPQLAAQPGAGNRVLYCAMSQGKEGG
ncbi:hypothetical protein BCR34DRAFT_588660 [Clohesyomyces aquaticus]|uniref:Uncharacterized protein n=1 Tax=Clohesyomyces aquaticus TaxID=1231657 RepID=A0A1Y1ZJF0_9PLEO|nr:hypothetical protein BCR34DRAFT_588660 [Clohesyomyces aquaticus]